MLKYTTSQKKTDLYDIGNGLTLMNIVTKNADGKPVQVDTYIGAEGDKFVRVGCAEELDVPGAMFNYANYVRMINANLSLYIRIYRDNVHSNFIQQTDKSI